MRLVRATRSGGWSQSHPLRDGGPTCEVQTNGIMIMEKIAVSAIEPVEAEPEELVEEPEIPSVTN